MFLQDSENGASVESKWEFIETALLRNIKSSRELEEAILSYNLEDGKAWKFNTMHTLFEQVSNRTFYSKQQKCYEKNML